MILVRNLIRVLLSHKEATDELYEKLRKDFTSEIETYRSSGKNEMAKTYDDILHLVNLLDALTINTIEDRKRMETLIESLLKSQEERDNTIRKLQEEIHKRDDEVNEFKRKYEKPLGWVDNYFKHSSETSPE